MVLQFIKNHPGYVVAIVLFVLDVVFIYLTFKTSPSVVNGNEKEDSDKIPLVTLISAWASMILGFSWMVALVVTWIFKL